MHLAKQALSFTVSRYFYISLQMLLEHQHLFDFKPELKFPTNVWSQNQKKASISPSIKIHLNLRVVNPLNSNGV